MKRRRVDSNLEVEKTASSGRDSAVDDLVDDYMSMPLDVLSDVPGPSRADGHGNSGPRKLSKLRRSELRVQLMNKAREEALAIPLGPSNKGFNLLAKMGYSEGGLGKDGAGIIGPIAVTHRPPAVTTGIGVDKELKEKLKKKADDAANLIARRDEIASEFMSAQTRLHETSKIARELKCNRKIIFNLDQQCGVGPHELWEEADVNEYAKEDASCDVIALLVQDMNYDELVSTWSASNKYLRDKHNYCVYCGCEYDNPFDMAATCPGLTEDDH